MVSPRKRKKSRPDARADSARADSAAPSNTISAPRDQLFECRDCPALCCRTWRIRLTSDEIDRYLPEPWIRERLDNPALRLISQGVLPMREKNHGLECVFLDDDGLCSMQRRFGHAYIPRACQAFPFGFVRDERGTTSACLSRLCPSIRDNYGKPIAPVLEDKLEQAEQVERMSTAMRTAQGTILSRSQYLRIAARWQDELQGDASPLEALGRLYDELIDFEETLPFLAQRATDEEVDQALEKGRARAFDPLRSRRSPSLHARVAFAALLGELCYPLRLRFAHRSSRSPLLRLEPLRAVAVRLAFLLQWGSVDLSLIARPVDLRRAAKVEPWLTGPLGELVRRYLLDVLDRRRIFVVPRYLGAVLVDLALGAVLISRFARCSAAADRRDTVCELDVRNGISVAELTLLHHALPVAERGIMKRVRLALFADRAAFRALVAGEV
jgi:lysine-N-methylase